MDIHQLQYFLQIVEQGSFTKAANYCGVTQPALSQQVARLEEEIGQPVFERQGRTIALTAAGEMLRDRAQQIVQMVEDTKAEITDDGRTGTIRVSAIPTVAPFFLPRLLKSFRDAYPDAAVEVNEDVTEELLRKCSIGEIDFGILALPAAAKYLEVEKLFEEELMLILPSDHRLLEKQQIRATDIQGLPFVLLSEAHCLSQSVEQYCHQKTFQPISTGRTSQLATVQELVALGHGISLVPQMAATIDSSTQRVYRSLAGDKPTRTIVVCWNAYRYQSRLMQNFLDTVRSTHSE